MPCKLSQGLFIIDWSWRQNHVEDKDIPGIRLSTDAVHTSTDILACMSNLGNPRERYREMSAYSRYWNAQSMGGQQKDMKFCKTYDPLRTSEMTLQW